MLLNLIVCIERKLFLLNYIGKFLIVFDYVSIGKDYAESYEEDFMTIDSNYHNGSKKLIDYYSRHL